VSILIINRADIVWAIDRARPMMIGKEEGKSKGNKLILISGKSRVEDGNREGEGDHSDVVLRHSTFDTVFIYIHCCDALLLLQFCPTFTFLQYILLHSCSLSDIPFLLYIVDGRSVFWHCGDGDDLPFIPHSVVLIHTFYHLLLFLW